MAIKKTESEEFFERFCADNGIPAKQIPVAEEQTPDYEISLGGVTVIAEVTQFDPNAEDEKYEKEIAEAGVATTGGIIGSRIRTKIGAKAGQLKARTHGTTPGILVLMNNTAVHSYTSDAHVLAAMYGFHTLVLSAPDGSELAVKGHQFGGGRKVTPDANTSLSALAILEPDSTGKPALRIYHNVHATAPLNPNLLQLASVKHFAPGPAVAGKSQGWAEIKTA